MSKGGKRKGAGRPPAPYQTKLVTFRVAIAGIPELKAFIESRQPEWRIQSEIKKPK
jgi:hypothetical protein